MQAPLPLLPSAAEALLSMAAEHLPSPLAAAPERLPRLLPPRREALKGLEPSPELAAALDASEAALGACDGSPDAPTVLYVSKMVAVPASALPRCASLAPWRKQLACRESMRLRAGLQCCNSSWSWSWRGGCARLDTAQVPMFVCEHRELAGRTAGGTVHGRRSCLCLHECTDA